ncbi:MAG: glycosyltransferase, partial [Pseudonocardiaceae bacterium]
MALVTHDDRVGQVGKRFGPSGKRDDRPQRFHGGYHYDRAAAVLVEVQSVRSAASAAGAELQRRATPTTAGADISVVVPTHNDGSNLAPLLTLLLGEDGVGEVLVIASGCDDETVPTVLELAEADDRVRLYVEPERSGKAAAVNFGLEEITLPFAVVISGDVLPDPGAITKVVDALRVDGVGLAGGRPIPVNSEACAIG